MSIVTKVTDALVKVQGSVDSTNASLFEEELSVCSFCYARDAQN